MSLTWDSTPNAAGYPGLSACLSGPAGVGTHGGMSRHELRNTLMARGPSFRRSTSIDTPTGNIDVAPTILHLMGLPGGEKMDGRVLHEALAGGEAVQICQGAVQRRTPQSWEITGRRSPLLPLAGSTYLDEGNAVAR